MTPKRKKFQDYVLKHIHTIDPSGYNNKAMKTFFDGLDDDQFDAWVKSLKHDKTNKIPLLVPPFKVVIAVENAFQLARDLDIEVTERIRYWDPVGKRYCLTPKKYFVMRLPARRLKQHRMDGLSVPDSDRRLNPLTDQVVKPDKGSAISFPQAQMIAEKGLTTTLHEMMNIRGGDREAYALMRSQIEDTGSSDTSVSEGTAGVKSARTLRTFFNALHMVTNL